MISIPDRVQNIKTVSYFSDQAKIKAIAHWKKSVNLDAQYALYATYGLDYVGLNAHFDLMTQCLIACQHNDFDKIKHLLADTSIVTNNETTMIAINCDSHHNTPLHYMALYCQPDTLSFLFDWMKSNKLIFNPNIENNMNCTAFDLASRRFDDDPLTKNVVLNFARWESSGLPTNLVDQLSEYSYVDISRIKDAAQLTKISKDVFKKIPELSVGVPIPNLLSFGFPLLIIIPAGIGPTLLQPACPWTPN